MDKLAKELKTMMTASDDRKPKPYDTRAEVLKVEDGVAWVHIPGGVQETPVRLTMNAKKGDIVNVRIASGSAWITGNGTNPPTDDTTANIANETASKAMSIGEMAMSDAERARVAANIAEEEAIRAGESATDAQDAADYAKDSAKSAESSAELAMDQLGIIENVVGVLDLIAEHGDYRVTLDSAIFPDKWYFTRSGESPNYIYKVVPNPTEIQYVLTTDTTIDPTKTYFTRTGTGTEDDPYVYTPVETPDVSEIETYYECLYYELVGVTQAVRNYISSQLVVNGEGLWLRRSENTGIKTKILLSSTEGVVLYGPDGKVVGKYGETAQIGNQENFHVDITGQQLTFKKNETEIAWLKNDQLYVEQAIALKDISVGGTQQDSGNGKWSWTIHKNAEGKNNLGLKWSW